MTDTVIEGSGQTAISGPGLERRLDTKDTGPQPEGAKVKLTGASVEWDGPQFQRQERHTFLVDVVVKGVSFEDDLNDSGYPKKTWRVHSCQVEDVRMVDDESVRGLRLATVEARMGAAQTQPHDDEPGDEAEGGEPVKLELAASKVRAGDELIHPRGSTPQPVLARDWPDADAAVRLTVAGGEVLELDPLEPVGVLRA